jgi:pseudouridylate synthase
MRVAEEVAAALAAGGPVVALESTIIAHGLPRPDNLRMAREIEDVVRAEGAVPATIAVTRGEVHVGLGPEILEQLALCDGVDKLSMRDLGPGLASGRAGATTVAATAHVAALAGIASFATGGLGGVHRGASATFDESADLTALASAPIVVVCAGVKSILDLGPTLERLETLNVTVLGYGTDSFPGFYLTDSGHPVTWRVDSPAEAASGASARTELGTDERALVVANPLPPDEQLDPALHDRVLAEGLAAAENAGVSGKDVTPFLLDFLARETGGQSLEANVRLVIRNAGLAARIALELAR